MSVDPVPGCHQTSMGPIEVRANEDGFVSQARVGVGVHGVGEEDLPGR